jgi:hypothetical protein
MIFRDEDKALNITITISDVLQSIDALHDLIVVLYNVRDRTVLASYRKVATVGFTTFLRISSTEYTAIVPHTIIASFPLTDIIVEIQMMETDIRFPDGIKRTKGKGVLAETIESVIRV